MSLFGVPLFIWFGIAGFVMFLAAMYAGLKRKPLKIHLRLAFSALILMIIHVLGAMGLY